MTTPNAELAYRVLDHIDAHPEQWDQDTYIAKAECGTVACFAGWTVLLSGATPHFGRYGIADKTYWVDRPGGGEASVPDLAEKLLGASRWVADSTACDDPDCDICEADLFDGDNSRQDIGRLVEAIFGPRPDREVTA